MKGNHMPAAKVAPKSPKSPKSPNAKPSKSMVTLSSVYAAKAAKSNIDTTRAAKLVRSRLRGNFAEVCKLSPNVAKAKKAANDGNRWPTHITRDLAKFILG